MAKNLGKATIFVASSLPTLMQQAQTRISDKGKVKVDQSVLSIGSVMIENSADHGGTGRSPGRTMVKSIARFDVTNPGNEASSFLAALGW